MLINKKDATSEDILKKSTSKLLPRPHQQEALQALYNAAQHEARYTCVMACGTGKTLVALWHAEQLQAQKILVLLPSLGLLNQTLHEWLKNMSFPSLKYLCVCSDQSIDSDEDFLQFRAEELDFNITTNVTEVAQFLKACNKDDTIVIFSTYHSADVIGRGIGAKFYFDLIIFDEAHKTAGEVGKEFSYALFDKNIKAKKRIFLTATPKIINPSKRNDVISELIEDKYNSMDNLELYGPVVYQLNFKQAVELGIIVNYKIVISVVTSESVQKILHHATLKFKNKKIDAVQIAHLLAIQHAVQEHSIKKLITFHSRVDVADSFQTMVDEHWFDVLENFNAFHVNGSMSSSIRSKKTRSFENSQNAVLTNARCLTEGIDVPVVDMIAFLCSKKSRIDIVQAAGRVMRCAPGKNIGYILIPFYVHSDISKIEIIEDQLKYSDYADLFYILKILSNYDHSLNDIINATFEKQGESGAIDHGVIKDRLVVTYSSELNFDILKNAISTLSMENIGWRWHYYYGLLKKFKENENHCNPTFENCADATLINWAKTQRRFYKSGDLNQERIELLEEIGFIWKIQESIWQENYRKLTEFKNKHGHCNITRSDSDVALCSWVSVQRSNYTQGNLSEKRIFLLNQLNFVWDIHKDSWNKMYKNLVKFKQDFNRSLVLTSDDSELSIWCTIQRGRYKNNKLPQNCIAQLNEIGFIWDAKKAIWYERCEELKQFKSLHGHCNVSKKYNEIKLVNWIVTQRRLYKQKKLTQKRITILNNIGLVLDPIEAAWQEKYGKIE